MYVQILAVRYCDRSVGCSCVGGSLAHAECKAVVKDALEAVYSSIAHLFIRLKYVSEEEEE